MSNCEEDYIAFRNRDICYFTTGKCKSPQDILRFAVIHNDIDLLDILYVNYRHYVNLQETIDYAIQMDRKYITNYLYNRGVMFSDDAVVFTAMNGNKNMLKWCLRKRTDINNGRLADALFKGGIYDTLEQDHELKVLIESVFR